MDEEKRKPGRKPEDCAHWKLYLLGEVEWNRWFSKKTRAATRKSMEEEFGELPSFTDDIDFKNVEFKCDVSFDGYDFTSSVSFEDSTFMEEVSFEGATFSDNAEFTAVTFCKAAMFDGVSFFRNARFEGSRFFQGAYFSGAKFRQGSYFSDSRFNLGGIFVGAEFAWEALFSCAIFKYDAAFNSAIFSGSCDFFKTRFSGNCNFTAAKFNWKADFSKASFADSAGFIGCQFLSTTKFEGCLFTLTPQFHDAKLHQDTSFYETTFECKDVNEDDAARAWRTLKLFMNVNHDHQREHQFFGYEMDAKLKQLKPKESLKDFIECGGMLLYKAVSNYGYSYGRPFVALMALAIVFWVIYSPFFCTLEESFNLSLASSVPFAGLSSSILKGFSDPHPGLAFLNVIQSILSIVLLFLTGLGIRNRFRIK